MVALGLLFTPGRDVLSRYLDATDTRVPQHGRINHFDHYTLKPHQGFTYVILSYLTLTCTLNLA
jgi:hypothetical protein